jgi:hypothetical protein
MSLSVYSCDWGFGKTRTQDPKYSTNKGTFAQKPCAENDEVNLKYNSLVDSLSNSFNYGKTFAEMKKSISIVKEIKVLQKESTCLIQQASKLESVRSKCEEMKLSSEEVLKVTDDSDLRERVLFYNQMIESLDE